MNSYPANSGLPNAHTTPATSKPDALLERRIMTRQEPSTASAREIRATSQSSQRKSEATSDDRLSPASDTQSVESTRTAKGTGSSSRHSSRVTKRKRGLSASSQDQRIVGATEAGERLPSISAGRSLDVGKPGSSSPGHICLCQPDPKVPRPRNAFILYRQHYQAKVVAENPGLANPEISKIIGDHWRQSSPEIKQHWKSLAEEEKLRHQRQYPDYRYQPKRGRNSLPAVSPGQASARCQKCGGKNIATPYLPSPGLGASQATPDPPASPYLPFGLTPRTPYGIPGGYCMSPSFPPAAYGQRPVPSGRTYEHPGDPSSPDAKRRRFEANARYPPRPIGSLTPVGMPPNSAAIVDQRLPRPEFLKHGGSASPGFMLSHGPHTPSGLRHDSLTLAPLKIKSPGEAAAFVSNKSVEAIVRAPRPLWKIKTLDRISKPLARFRGPRSAVPAVHGAVVALEGGINGEETIEAMEMVAHHVKHELQRAGEHVVRAWAGPPAMDPMGRNPALLDVLELMTHWHWISREVVKYITTMPETVVGRAEDEDEVAEGGLPSPSDGGVEMASPKTVVVKPTTTPEMRLLGQNGRDNDKIPVPVALIPNYQLTSTDVAAISASNADQYSPIDHWRWIAALWRGTVGPDVVICIRGPNEADGMGSPMDQGQSDKGGRCGVDVKLDEARTIIVRTDKDGEVSEQVLRRVAFEVGEWLRGREDREREHKRT